MYASMVTPPRIPISEPMLAKNPMNETNQDEASYTGPVELAMMDSKLSAIGLMVMSENTRIIAPHFVCSAGFDVNFKADLINTAAQTVKNVEKRIGNPTTDQRPRL